MSHPIIFNVWSLTITHHGPPNISCRKFSAWVISINLYKNSIDLAGFLVRKSLFKNYTAIAALVIRYVSPLDSPFPKRIITSQAASTTNPYVPLFQWLLTTVIWFEVISYRFQQWRKRSHQCKPAVTFYAKPGSVCKLSAFSRKSSALSTASHNHFQTHRVSLKWQPQVLFHWYLFLF